MSRLKQSKQVLVTGATSGFGKLAVRLLLQRGHRVIAGVRGGQSRLVTVFAEELRSYPGRLSAVDLHLDRPESIATAVEAVECEFGGRLDALVNNAGFALLGPYETQSDADVTKQFEVNFFGPMRLTRALLPALKLARGTVVNVSSIGGLVTFPFYGAYNASKFALEALSESLYYDLRSQGIHVALVEPGSFRTELVAAAQVGEALAGSAYEGPVRRMISWMERNLKLAGDPAKVARVIVRRVEQRRPPVRTLVGADAWLMSLARRWLPERLRVAATERVFRKLVLAK